MHHLEESTSSQSTTYSFVVPARAVSTLPFLSSENIVFDFSSYLPIAFPRVEIKLLVRLCDLVIFRNTASK